MIPDGAEMMGQLSVSRETMDRLRVFSDLVKKWNPAINLVSRKSIEDLWARHIADSLQVYRLAPVGRQWVDMGSGAGFPGLVSAIAAIDEAPGMDFTLIESDQRKSAFLRTAILETGVNAHVLTRRIENAPPQGADILSARALADLTALLGYADRHLGCRGVALFQKGVTWRKEIDDARRYWQFEAEAVTSMTEAEAVILKIRNIERV